MRRKNGASTVIVRMTIVDVKIETSAFKTLEGLVSGKTDTMVDSHECVGVHSEVVLLVLLNECPQQKNPH